MAEGRGEMSRGEGCRQIEMLGSHGAGKRGREDVELGERVVRTGGSEGIAKELERKRRETKLERKEGRVIVHGREEGEGGNGDKGSEMVEERRKSNSFESVTEIGGNLDFTETSGVLRECRKKSE